jgi:AraC-like DNA-binding protein
MDTAKGNFPFTIFKGDRNTILSRILLLGGMGGFVFPLYLYDTTYFALIGQNAPASLLKGKLGEFESSERMLFLLGIDCAPGIETGLFELNIPFKTVSLSAEQAELLAKLLKKLYNGYQKAGNIPFQRLYLSMLLQSLGEILSKERSFRNREETLAQGFMALVNSQSYPEHQVNYYAEKLFVSRRYLTKAVHATLGTTPKSIIDKRIIEISIKLLSRDNPIYSIAEELRFESPASFTTFFKKHTGYSPSHYRNLNTP